jgi:hypothetical protein
MKNVCLKNDLKTTQNIRKKLTALSHLFFRNYEVNSIKDLIQQKVISIFVPLTISVIETKRKYETKTK